VRVDVAGGAGGGDLALVDSHVEAAAYRSSGVPALKAAVAMWLWRGPLR
jgi:hypothetical protein